MHTITETYDDYFKWNYVFIMSNSMRFRKKSAKSCAKHAQKLRNPVHYLKTCANLLTILNRFAQLLAGSEQVVNR